MMRMARKRFSKVVTGRKRKRKSGCYDCFHIYVLDYFRNRRYGRGKQEKKETMGKSAKPVRDEVKSREDIKRDLKKKEQNKIKQMNRKDRRTYLKQQEQGKGKGKGVGMGMGMGKGGRGGKGGRR